MKKHKKKKPAGRVNEALSSENKYSLSPESTEDEDIETETESREKKYSLCPERKAQFERIFKKYARDFKYLENV